MSSIPVRASSFAPPKVQKNALGSRTDIAWEHGVSVDGGTRKIKCSYCSKEVIGAVYRLKHHLACTQINVEDADEIVTGKRSVEDDGNATPAKLFKKKGMSTQSTINSIFKKNLREEACLEIASFFYKDVIVFNVSLDDDILDFTIENGDLEVGNQNDGENGIGNQDDLEVHNLEDEDYGEDEDDLDVGLAQDALNALLN
ncbi:hypothetical protein KIW84_015670 [Lathyrus oleraceus]|uniref:BED-type domain-containing protein n=1 Tax=Pisum sativum TaxID=3888 RepID=A0A9D5BR98_PEA|nr:hypothetical protein KIW84_015670 [Pisum sativum]